MGIVVIGAIYVDIKGFPYQTYVPDGRNAGYIEYIHGGVSRNVVEDIANVELRPTLISLVDDSAMGHDVIRKLQNHKVDTRYVLTKENGMGTWLAVFDEHGDLAGSISQRADLSPLNDLLDEKGDEIFSEADSVAIQVDLNKELVKRVIKLSKKYNKKLYGVVANMSIAVERRDLLHQFDCIVCNDIEAGIFFIDDYSKTKPEALCEILAEKVKVLEIPGMVVTMGSKGAVYASFEGEKGVVPAKKVIVKDTTGAGDSFFAGVTIGLTYGKSLKESVEIGTTLAASVIVTSENVCPRFNPGEFGLNKELIPE